MAALDEAGGVQLTNGDEPGVKLRKIRNKKGKRTP
jgi:hypothetical protein